MHNESGHVKCSSTFVSGGDACKLRFGAVDVVDASYTHLSCVVDQVIREADPTKWTVSLRRLRHGARMSATEGGDET